MIGAADIRESETVATAGAKGHSDQRFVSPIPFVDSIVHGDNCDVLGQLPRNCIDLVVTSPPYDDLRTYGGHSWDFYGVAWQLKRVLKPGGVIVWVVADQTKNGSESGTSMRQALHFQTLGLNLHDTMIYQTDKPPLNDNRYQGCFEFMFVLSKGRPKTFNPLMDSCVKYGSKSTNYSGHRDKAGDFKERSGGKFIANEKKIRISIWKYYVGQGSEDAIAFDHPARFASAMAKDHITSWTNPGELVLDPFSGSGTTVAASKELNRHWIGIDVNEDYCKMGNARIAQDLLGLG